MRIAPRTLLCGTAWRVQANVAGAGFEELRQLCTAAGDKASLAIGMAELVIDHAYHDRIWEAAELANEVMALTESIGDPNLTVGLSVPVLYAKTESAEHSDLLRWADRVIDLADGDSSKGDLLIGSPLAFTYASRAIARYGLGRPGWRDDMRHGVAMARSADPLSYAATVALSYFGGIPNGVLRPGDSVVHEIEEALWIAERSGDDLAGPTPRRRWGWRWRIDQPMERVTSGRRCSPRSAMYSCAGSTTWPIYRSSTCTYRVRGLGVEIAMTPYR